MTASPFASAARYAATAPDRGEIDALAGAVVLEFGADWCGHCQRAQPLIETAFARHAHTGDASNTSSTSNPRVRHLKIGDGPGRALGRSFRVKLWPTLIFLRDGVEVARVVRPRRLTRSILRSRQCSGRQGTLARRGVTGREEGGR